MVRVPRFITSRIVSLHGYINQNYQKILILCLLVGTGTGALHWLARVHPEFFSNLQENIKEFPFGVTFGVLTVVLISTLLLYALHLESMEKTQVRSRTAIRLKYVDCILLCLASQLKDVTERYLRRQDKLGSAGVVPAGYLDAMHGEIEDCIERFRESARKLLHAPAASTVQELENYFRLDQLGVSVGEEILKLKRNSKSLLSERAIKELFT